MSYRCQLCREVVPRNRPRLLHVVYRIKPNPLAGAIEREIPVCPGCKTALDRGATLRELMAPQVVIEPPRLEPAPIVVPPPPPPAKAAKPRTFSSIEL